MKDFTIANLPAGNSKGNEFHLATEIAKSLAEKMDIPHSILFLPYLRKNYDVGNVTNKQRLIRSESEIPDKIILIDDVSTTGTSIESATNRLKQHSRMVIPIVWVAREIKSE